MHALRTPVLTLTLFLTLSRHPAGEAGDGSRDLKNVITNSKVYGTVHRPSRVPWRPFRVPPGTVRSPYRLHRCMYQGARAASRPVKGRLGGGRRIIRVRVQLAIFESYLMKSCLLNPTSTQVTGQCGPLSWQGGTPPRPPTPRPVPGHSWWRSCTQLKQARHQRATSISFSTAAPLLFYTYSNLSITT